MAGTSHITEDALTQEGVALLSALCDGIMKFSASAGCDPQFALAHTQFWQKVYPGWHEDLLVSIYGVRPRAFDALPVGTVIFSPSLAKLKEIRRSVQWSLAAQVQTGHPVPPPAGAPTPMDERGSGKVLPWRSRE